MIGEASYDDEYVVASLITFTFEKVRSMKRPSCTSSISHFRLDVSGTFCYRPSPDLRRSSSE